MHITESGSNAAVDAATGRELLACLVRGERLGAAVPVTLAIVERDPLATSGGFRGDFMRGLMEVPGRFWGRQPQLYERYVHALRASAGARRRLPPDERMDFWLPLDI